MSAANAEFAPSRWNVCTWYRHAAGEQAQANEAVADDHDCASRWCRARASHCPPPAAQHHGQDQRRLDDGDRDREDERSERLADAVRDNLRVMHGRQHRTDQQRRAERRAAPGRAAPPSRRPAARRPRPAARRPTRDERRSSASWSTVGKAAIVPEAGCEVVRSVRWRSATRRRPHWSRRSLASVTPRARTRSP